MALKLRPILFGTVIALPVYVGSVAFLVYFLPHHEVLRIVGSEAQRPLGSSKSDTTVISPSSSRIPPDTGWQGGPPVAHIGVHTRGPNWALTQFWCSLLFVTQRRSIWPEEGQALRVQTSGA